MRDDGSGEHEDRTSDPDPAAVAVVDDATRTTTRYREVSQFYHLKRQCRRHVDRENAERAGVLVSGDERTRLANWPAVNVYAFSDRRQCTVEGDGDWRWRRCFGVCNDWSGGQEVDSSVPTGVEGQIGRVDGFPQVHLACDRGIGKILGEESRSRPVFELRVR